MFERLISSMPRPVRVLDVGGEVAFWERMDLAPSVVEVTIVNITTQPSRLPYVRAQVGDAGDLSRFANNEFDVAFSNSMIEHLRTWPNQVRAAEEIRRVAPRHFVQTPSRSFPLEPHFLVPGFQFLPLRARAWLLQRFDLGHIRRRTDPAEAREAVSEIRLLTARELRVLFPDAVLYRERLVGLTKSFIAIGGWGA